MKRSALSNAVAAPLLLSRIAHCGFERLLDVLHVGRTRRRNKGIGASPLFDTGLPLIGVTSSTLRCGQPGSGDISTVVIQPAASLVKQAKRKLI